MHALSPRQNALRMLHHQNCAAPRIASCSPSTWKSMLMKGVGLEAEGGGEAEGEGEGEDEGEGEGEGEGAGEGLGEGEGEGEGEGAAEASFSAAHSARNSEPSTPMGEVSALNSAVRGVRQSGDNCKGNAAAESSR